VGGGGLPVEPAARLGAQALLAVLHHAPARSAQARPTRRRARAPFLIPPSRCQSPSYINLPPTLSHRHRPVRPAAHAPAHSAPAARLVARRRFLRADRAGTATLERDTGGASPIPLPGLWSQSRPMRLRATRARCAPLPAPAISRHQPAAHLPPRPIHTPYAPPAAAHSHTLRPPRSSAEQGSRWR
jgi:hypothetical protein